MTPLKLVKVVHDGQSYWLLLALVALGSTDAAQAVRRPVRPVPLLDCRASGNGNSEGLDTRTIAAAAPLKRSGFRFHLSRGAGHVQEDRLSIESARLRHQSRDLLVALG